jgi:hypothetical protein
VHGDRHLSKPFRVVEVLTDIWEHCYQTQRSNKSIHICKSSNLKSKALRFCSTSWICSKYLHRWSYDRLENMYYINNL